MARSPRRLGYTQDKESQEKMKRRKSKWEFAKRENVLKIEMIRLADEN